MVQLDDVDTEEHASHLDSVLDFPSVVSDDEGRLHDSRELDVAVSFMLTLELVQQGLIGCLGETLGNSDFIRNRETQDCLSQANSLLALILQHPFMSLKSGISCNYLHLFFNYFYFHCQRYFKKGYSVSDAFPLTLRD